MRNRLATILLATSLAYLGFGCNKSKSTTEEGSANISVKGSALSLDDIDRITVTISGSGINPDIVEEITGDPVNGWSETINDIPAGDGRTFAAEHDLDRAELIRALYLDGVGHGSQECNGDH